MKTPHFPLRGIFLLAMVFIPHAVFSQNIFTLNSQYVETALYKNSNRGTEALSSFASISYANNSSFAGDWNFLASFRGGDETEEFTASIDFWPEVCSFDSSNFSFGHKLIYHYLDYGRWCYENDIVLEPFVKYEKENSWYFKSSFGLGFKEQKIKIIDNWLDQVYFVLETEFNKKISENFEAYFLFGNHDNYRFYLFPSPLYTIGATCTFNGRYRFYLNWQLHCCDMFTTKFFLNGEQLSGGVRIYL